MAAAGELLAGGQPVLGGDAAVPERCGDAARDRKGRGGKGGEAGSRSPGRSRRDQPLVAHVRVQLFEGEAGFGAGLKHLLHEFELDAAAGGFLGKPDGRSGLVDQQELLLDTNAPHPATFPRERLQVPRGEHLPGAARSQPA